MQYCAHVGEIKIYKHNSVRANFVSCMKCLKHVIALMIQIIYIISLEISKLTLVYDCTCNELACLNTIILSVNNDRWLKEFLFKY